MKKHYVLIFCLLSAVLSHAQAPKLKSVIFDFDGLDIGAVNLPDGDYQNYDLTYKVAANPLAPSDVLGDRVLELTINWNLGKGEFGKGVTKYFELDPAKDHFNFYIYHPLSNGNDAVVDVEICEDDNMNNVYEESSDDRWVSTQTIVRSGAWQLISIPLNSFTDGNTGGNGIFDAVHTLNAGKVFVTSLVFKKPSSGSTSQKTYIDMLCFSEGVLPTGTTIMDPPLKNQSDYCLLGALSKKDTPDSTAGEIESIFSNGKKLRYVHWFMDYAGAGTVANNIPSATSVNKILTAGYRPIITWEMMYAQYSRLDPVQPRLDKILNGYFDSYIDAFADKIKSFDDTIIMRIFHEFDGDWYSWSIIENGQDPNIYKAAYKYVVDRFKAKGVNKVQWMWCPNSRPKPYSVFNWIINAYPGDEYVDIVATDVYNHPDGGIPDWKSFRYTYSEPYYYLTKYFPHKPLYLCENASRERYSSEPAASQTKAEWICQTSKDLKSYFSKTRALVFFSIVKEHDWRVNSSLAATEAIRTCIWEDPYFSDNPVYVAKVQEKNSLQIYPNPFNEELWIKAEGQVKGEVCIYDMMGKCVGTFVMKDKIAIGNTLSAGVYVLEIKNGNYLKKMKVVKN